MADFGEFGRAVAQVEGVPDVFTFHSEPFILPPAMSALPALRFAWRGRIIDQKLQQAKNAAARALTAEQHQQAAIAEASAEQEAMAAVYEFLQASLPDDWDRFEAVAIRVGAGLDELMGVCQAIYAAVTGRPTQRPSESSDGPSTTGPSWTEGSASPATSTSPPTTEAVPGPSARDRQVAVFLQDMQPVGSLR